MKIIRIALIILVALIALVVLAGFFMPGNVETQQEVTIKAKPEVVFAHVNNLKNWDLWAKWNQMDPDWKVTYSSSAKGQGASYDWESEDPMVGAGTMTITESIENQLVKTRLDFRDWHGADTEMRFRADGANTIVSWSFVGDQAGNDLFARYMNAFMKGMLDTDLGEGLSQLKSIAESQSMVMEIEEMPEMTVAYVSAEASSDQLTPTLARSYGAIVQHLADQGAEMTMMPMANYVAYENEKAIFEPMAAINKTIDESDMVKVKVMPKAKMAVFYHYGNYTGLSAAHEEAVNLLTAMGFEAGVPSLEIYETDPGLEPDPNKWLTKLCFKID